MSEKMMVIDFAPTGEVTAMHRDEFNLAFLGNQKIERASDIKFDDTKQLWAIHLKDGDGFVANPPDWLSGFPTYDSARDFEVRFLEQCRVLSIDPRLPIMGAIARTMRWDHFRKPA